MAACMRGHPAALPLGSSELRSQRRAAPYSRRGSRLRPGGDRAGSRPLRRERGLSLRPGRRDGPARALRAALSGGGRRRGRRLHLVLPRHGGDRPSRRELRDHARGGGLAGHLADREIRFARTAAVLARAAARRGAPLGVRAHRARRRVGRCRNPDARSPRRRSLGHQRSQGVHHQRRAPTSARG